LHEYLIHDNIEYCGLELELAKSDLFGMIKGLYPKTADIRFYRGLFRKIVDAMVYLHDTAKIAHNDLKLDNIFLFDNYEPKIADFGFASHLDVAND